MTLNAVGVLGIFFFGIGLDGLLKKFWKTLLSSVSALVHHQKDI